MHKQYEYTLKYIYNPGLSAKYTYNTPDMFSIGANPVKIGAELVKL